MFLCFPCKAFLAAVEPHQHSEGVDYVFVNGVAVVEAGTLTQALAGKVLVR